MPVSDPLSVESRGSVQIDVRPLLVKEPGHSTRQTKAAHFGRLFVPLRSRGLGLSAAITRDLRALVQSGALAAPLDAVELFYGQAEPKLSGICAPARSDIQSDLSADGRTSWHRFAMFGAELDKPLLHSTSADSSLKVEPVHLDDIPAVGALLAARLRSRVESIESDKVCCAILPTAVTIEHRVVGQLYSFNQLRGERAPFTLIGARIGNWTDDDVSLVLWLPRLGDARTCSQSQRHLFRQSSKSRRSRRLRNQRLMRFSRLQRTSRAARAGTDCASSASIRHSRTAQASSSSRHSAISLASSSSTRILRRRSSHGRTRCESSLQDVLTGKGCSEQLHMAVVMQMRLDRQCNESVRVQSESSRVQRGEQSGLGHRRRLVRLQLRGSDASTIVRSDLLLAAHAQLVLGAIRHAVRSRRGEHLGANRR